MIFKCSFQEGSQSHLACDLAKQKIEGVLRNYRNRPASVDLSFHSEGKCDYVELLIEDDHAFEVHLLGQGRGFRFAIDDVATQLKTTLNRREKRMRKFAHEVNDSDVWELAALGVLARQNDSSGGEKVLRYGEAS